MDNVTNSDNPLLDRKYCYHGIGGALFRLPSILEHGILPPKSIKLLNMPENFDSSSSYNGSNHVSVIISPQFCSGPNTLGGGYSEGITFVCETNYWQGPEAKRSGIPFEAHTSEILPEKIKGIILPNSFFEKPIRDCGDFFGGYSQYEAICSSFQKFMDEECFHKVDGYDIDIRLMKASLENDKYKDKLKTHIFSDLQEAIDKKLGKKDSTFADIVNFYIKDKPHIKLYNREALQNDVQRPNNIEYMRNACFGLRR